MAEEGEVTEDEVTKTSSVFSSYADLANNSFAGRPSSSNNDHNVSQQQPWKRARQNEERGSGGRRPAGRQYMRGGRGGGRFPNNQAAFRDGGGRGNFSRGRGRGRFMTRGERGSSAFASTGSLDVDNASVSSGRGSVGESPNPRAFPNENLSIHNGMEIRGGRASGRQPFDQSRGGAPGRARVRDGPRIHMGRGRSEATRPPFEGRGYMERGGGGRRPPDGIERGGRAMRSPAFQRGGRGRFAAMERESRGEIRSPVPPGRVGRGPPMSSLDSSHCSDAFHSNSSLDPPLQSSYASLEMGGPPPRREPPVIDATSGRFDRAPLGRFGGRSPRFRGGEFGGRGEPLLGRGFPAGGGRGTEPGRMDTGRGEFARGGGRLFRGGRTPFGRGRFPDGGRGRESPRFGAFESPGWQQRPTHPATGGYAQLHQPYAAKSPPMVTDLTANEKGPAAASVKVREPSPEPPPSPPPKPSEPSELTKSMIRLSELELNLSVLATSHRKLGATRDQLRVDLERMKKMLVGFDAIKEDYEKFIREDEDEDNLNNS